MYPINSDILAIFQNGSMQYARVTIGTAGQTGYQLIENDRIKQGGLSVNRFAETGDTVKVGSCASAELSLVLDNRDGVYDDYDFIGKEACVEIGVDNGGTISYVPIGYFTFDEAAYDKSALRLMALDRMLFFERTIDASQLSFPYTVTQLLSRICTVCGVPLGNIGTLLNGGISVPSLPNDAKTYRDLLVWIAEISGNVAYIAYDGTLMLKWYQGSQFSLTTANRKDSTLERGSVIITGIEFVVNDTTTVYGTADRTIRIENNPLIPSGQESFIATGLYNKLVGFTYTPFTASVLPMPHIEPLDGCTFVTADGESVFVPITDWSFALNGSCRLAGKSNQATYRRGYGLADVILQGVNIADKAVTTTKIADNAVDTAQLAALAVKEGKIAANAVTENKIAANAVVADKIASNAVTTDKLNALAVTAAKIASGAVTADKINAGAVTTAKLDAGAVTTAKLDAGAVTAAKIATGAVTADKISVTDLQAIGATIANWNIGANMLYKTITSGGYEYRISMQAPASPTTNSTAFCVERRTAGSTGAYTSLFNTTYGGKLTATNADISGKITATDGTIGGLSISQNSITSSNGYFELSDTGVITIKDSLRENKIWTGGFQAKSDEADIYLDGQGHITMTYDDNGGADLRLSCEYEPSVNIEPLLSITHNGSSGTEYHQTYITPTKLEVDSRDLLTEFKAHTQYFATNIPANANLKTSTYLNPGRYVCRQTATAATLSNCPVSTAFSMDVDYPISLFNTVPSTWGYILRTITTLNGQQWIQYVEIDGNGTTTWNDWVQLRASTNGGNVIKQIDSTGNYEYRVLLSETNSNDTLCERIRKSGGLTYNPASGAVYIRRQHSATATNSSSLVLGNSTADGTAGASYGTLYIYGKGTKYARFQDSDNILTANRIYTLPNKDGELAILESTELNAGNRNVVARGVNEAKYIGFATKAGGSCYLHYSAAGNHGILSSGYESSLTDTSTYTAGQVWIIERLGASGNVTIPNWSSKGSASKPVYFNSSGYPVAGNEVVSTSKSAASGGTDLSLVTTGEKYTWNSKTSNTGTVTSVAVSGSKGISISGSPVTTSGTVTVSVDTASGTATRDSSNVASGASLTYVRYGKVVYIYGSFSISNTATGKTMFTGLPAPEKSGCYVTSLGSTASTGGSVFAIDSSGKMTIVGRAAAGGYNYISATYIADY